mgnify:CR=1 FL=1
MLPDIQKLEFLLAEVQMLQKNAIETELKNRSLLEKVHPQYLHSAKNLLHYLSIRSHDLTALQFELSSLAISSLTHSEAYTLNNLYKIENLIKALLGKSVNMNVYEENGFSVSLNLKEQHTESVFGKGDYKGQTRIMVTMPTEAAENIEMIYNFIERGMHIARINTAHDDEAVWEKIVHNIKKASKDLQKPVKIYADLAGPKLRVEKILENAHYDKKKNNTYIPVSIGTSILMVQHKHYRNTNSLPVISTSLPEIFNFIKKGEKIWFDDGKAGGLIKETGNGQVVIEIQHVPKEIFKLSETKGINLPETVLDIEALTEEDKLNLDFLARHMDLIGFSFVQKPADVLKLKKLLEEKGRPDMGIVLKIENRQAFNNLPNLLLAGMQHGSLGIMIARGDLAVEIGWEEMAEVQEEILWLAESAHVPVIWATQVLENLAKKGIATRAEISDAVKSGRAECVMLNKGPYIEEAMTILQDINKRMKAHEEKKMKLLSRLKVAQTFVQESF